MAVTPIYELTIPAPHDTSFVDGEKALSVAATLSGAAGQTTYYLSKWFDLRGGAYTFKVVSEDASVWLASVSKNNGRTIYKGKAGDGVVTAIIYLPPGRQRIDVIIGNVASGTSSCYVAFSLVQDASIVYTSAGAGWVFDTVPIEDADVPAIQDYRLTLPVMSILPNWQDGVTESLEWKTEVMASESDREQRRSLRRYPRRSFEAGFMRHDLRLSRLLNFLIGSGSSEMLLPLWHEQFKIPATLTGTLQFPSASLAYREFFAGDLVWVNNGDPLDGEVLQIASADTGTDLVTFTAAPVGTWPAGSRVFPLRVARALEVSQFDHMTDRVARAQIRFHLKEHEKWPAPSWGSASPLFAFKINRGVSLNVILDRTTDVIIDNDIGRVETFDIYERTRLSSRFSMTLRGRTRVHAFRQFIHMARGKTVRFWMPSLTLDLIALGDMSGSHIDVRNAGLVEYLKRAQDTRAMVAFVFRNGDATVYRKVTLITETLSGERVFLQTALSGTIDPANIERLQFVVPARFDQDSFDLVHVVDDSAVVQTSVVVRSSDTGDLPDL